MISYEYYRVFYYVAKYRSFTRAADLLLTNQPNVTRTIKNLESALGCILFIRSNRGVTLTPEGELLFSHVAVAVEQIQAGEDELLMDRQLEHGVISVGASETALHELLLSVLSRFHESHPGIRIRISNHSTPQAIAALNSGAVEFSVVTTPTGVRKPILEFPLKPFREIPVCGASTSMAALRDRPLHLRDLLQYPIISLGRETRTYEFYNALFLQHGLPFQPDMEAATADQILPLVKSGLGIGFLPEAFAVDAIKAGEIFTLQLEEEIPARHVCLLRRSDRPLSFAARELIRQLTSVAAGAGIP